MSDNKETGIPAYDQMKDALAAVILESANAIEAANAEFAEFQRHVEKLTRASRPDEVIDLMTSYATQAAQRMGIAFMASYERAGKVARAHGFDITRPAAA